ncbi:hypothetical protein FN846DRAFT_906871 [Sphaerosporella brunnea]|uniref:Uncharacterized protein n=1 Tax=Sphaerosporella brunnea TaxID=1250544 RepID=A0A5J5EYY8_9PEZI|nr:hypothetical protein FN846DRAFT_906871 [Sphaerosporella brunnea]
MDRLITLPFRPAPAGHSAPTARAATPPPPPPPTITITAATPPPSPLRDKALELSVAREICRHLAPGPRSFVRFLPSERAELVRCVQTSLAAAGFDCNERRALEVTRQAVGRNNRVIERRLQREAKARREEEGSTRPDEKKKAGRERPKMTRKEKKMAKAKAKAAAAAALDDALISQMAVVTITRTDQTPTV